jgi:branched-subunit amino acid ABC-type transport system permease component
MLAAAIGLWHVTAETLAIGALTGLAYAVLAAGLVLVYRATRVINFAHGEIGAFGATLLAKVVLDWHWNFFVALAAVLVVGGALGAVVELGVVRRLFDAPRLILLVATIGVSQLVFVLEVVLPDVEAQGAPYPTPVHHAFHVLGMHLGGQHVVLLVVAPIVIGALTWFLAKTWYGVAIRASADDADRAELVGISTKRISTLVWVIAGVLSTLTAVLLNPVRGVVVGLPTQALGPGLLLRALAAALVGGLVSLPLALVGGIAIGVVEAVMFANVGNPGTVDLVLFVAVLVLVFVRSGGRREERSTWSLAPKVRAVPERLRSVWWVRHLNLLAGGAAVVVAALLPVAFPTSARA